MAAATDHTPLDRRLAALATAQHGVVSLHQLRELGLATRTVADRVAAGRLHRIHRGVYAVGHRRITREGRWMAATLACGEGAVLSHRSAASLLNLRRTARSRIDVTSRTRAGRRHAGIDVHSGARLHADDVTSADGIPCTTVARTLLDLAEVTDDATTKRVVERADTLQVFDLIAIRKLLARSPGRRGAPRLLEAIASHKPTMTRSEMEDRFLTICELAAVPRPLVNTKLGRIEVDFMWADQRVVVETDGYETHGTRAAFAADRRRDRGLRKQGWRVERFSWWEIAGEPRAVGGELASILDRAARANPR